MATSRRSPKRKSAPPQPTNTAGRIRGLLGIRGGPGSAIGSATMTIFPQSIRKSSLRNASKTPSPEANRVRFAIDGYSSSATGHQYQKTPRMQSAGTSATTASGLSKCPRQTTPTSPQLRFSPKTAQKAKKAATITQGFLKKLEELETKLPSPPPVNSKATRNNFTGTGVRIGTGLPPTPSTSRSGTKSPNQASKNPNTGLLSPPESIDKATQTGSQTRKIYITYSPTKQRQIYIDGVSDWLALPKPPTVPNASNEAIEIPTSALLSHMTALKATPKALTLEEIHVQFYLLQKMLRQFSKANFNAPWSASRHAAFSLADLERDHAPFFRMLSYIADGSSFQNGWADFLTSEHTRPHIVYGVLSEWLKHNVFGHSCFGLSEEEDQQMRNIDIRYLKWDGFVRTKERAKLLRTILDNKPAWEQDLDMGTAVAKVVNDLLVVLAPILPPDTTELKEQMHTLIELAASLHHCIRLTGIDGTILWLRSSEKGDQFAYTARQNCVNKSTVSKMIDDMIAQRNKQHATDAEPRAAAADERSSSRASSTTRRTSQRRSQAKEKEQFSRPKDKLLIKMACFPLVQATVPYGPTLKDFAVEQALYESVVRSADLPKLDSKGPMYIEDIPAEIVRASCFEELPESCSRDYGMRSREGQPKMKAFGSYVRTYILNESDVYCEWEFDGEEGNPGKGLTLRQAINEAQKEKYGYVPAEQRVDREKRLRKVQYVATAGVAAALVLSIAHHMGVTGAAVSAVRNLGLPTSFSIEDIKGAVNYAMKAADAKTKVFRSAAASPYKIGKKYASAWASEQLASAKSQLETAQLRVGELYNSTATITDKIKDAAGNLTEGTSNLTSEFAHLAISKASEDLAAATSVLKEAVLPDETVEPTTRTGLLSSILPAISIGVHETPVKLGIEIGKVADVTSKVSKTTRTALKEQATSIATSAAKRWYEQFARRDGN